jgi:hypothetical protein
VKPVVFCLVVETKWKNGGESGGESVSKESGWECERVSNEGEGREWKRASKEIEETERVKRLIEESE